MARPDTVTHPHPPVRHGEPPRAAVCRDRPRGRRRRPRQGSSDGVHVDAADGHSGWLGVGQEVLDVIQGALGRRHLQGHRTAKEGPRALSRVRIESPIGVDVPVRPPPIPTSW